MGVALWILVLSVAACLPWTVSMPPLFAAGESIQEVDFESNAISRTPSEFEASSEGWAVANSPTAVSGFQVLVRDGAAPSDLKVAGTSGSRRVEGEVGVRVLLGSAGAGIACATGEAESYLVILEPEAERVALYRRTGETRTLVTSHPISEKKGSWSRVGIQCDPSRVVGYWGGKRVMQTRATIGAAVTLALRAEGGVVAQFDDLKYAAQR